MQSIRISRRSFLKINAVLASAAAISIALPAAALAKSLPATGQSPTAEPIELDIALPVAVRFGTPTDVAATWAGQAWSVDVEGVIRKFDRSRGYWVTDGDESDFPLNSQMVLARWGRPAGPNQMLMVLA